ncbi:MAG: polyprenyl synthetase family protein [Sulfitobacter sp.]|nr:polyprenyl synthetase family protein [Sulfitobacter sp.]
MFRQRLAAAQDRIGAHLSAHLAGFADLPLTRAMRHATDGGKRLRGFLVLESAHLHGIDPEQAIWPACAIEAMHAYSLVHDDLPCMDDDDLRRGQPTVHIAWNEETAVLAGDALQSLAFEMTCHEAVGSGAVRATLASTLALAAGAQGMVLGQALDIAAETSERLLTLDEITHLQQGKTGALILWSSLAGPRMAQADEAPLHSYATALGLAFQIADDILDVEGDSAEVGKATGKDAAAGKATFVSLLGLEGARQRAHDLVQSACDALESYGNEADALRGAARFVIDRKN